MYREGFYRYRKQETQQSAELVGRFLMESVQPLRSVVDFGCGVGVWLAELSRLGTESVLGLDGRWVNPDLLEIDRDAFRPTDLASPLDLERRFDLAISLEVAEHLPEEAALGFVQSLTRASDLVLFSAAIPGQPGTNHVNSQWQSYWAQRFSDCGYVAFDVVRPRFWHDARVRYFYRQNMLLYAREDNRALATALRSLPNWCTGSATVADLVHPELFAFVLRKQESAGESFKLFRRNLTARVAQFLGGR
jgi:SAM-dependent methyltransferase